MGETKAKNEYKNNEVNKANRPHMLIKDGIRTLITNDLFKVSGNLWTPTNLFL